MNPYALAKPLLFRLDPETAHNLTMTGLRQAHALGLLKLFMPRVPALPKRVMGLDFPNPVGLAAGLDKNGEAIDALGDFGFGFIEVGAVTPRPQPGNPKPRLFRLPQDRAIVVNYGLPNDGAHLVAQRFAQLQSRLRAPLGANIVNTNRGAGVKAESNDEIIADYVASVARLQPHATYLVLNLSCPNTCDGRAFVSDSSRVRQLLAAVGAIPPSKPLFLKVAPFPDPHSLDAFLQAVQDFDFVSGFSINLPPGKPPGITASPQLLASMPGAVSGHPCEAAANRAIAEIYRRIDPRRYSIIGSGGVFSAQDAWRKITLGASLVQCLTCLVYEGPTVISNIARGLAHIARRQGLRSIQDAVGIAARP